MQVSGHIVQHPLRAALTLNWTATGTQRWIDSLELPVSMPWHPWSGGPGSFISGYTTVYSGRGIGSNFTFTTIRDAGHMAPRYKPSETLHMITRFLKNQPM